MEILGGDGSTKRIIWNPYMRGGYAVWPVGQDCELHAHKDAVEIFVILDGKCEMTVGEEVRVVGPGETIYVGPADWHRLVSIGERPLEMFWAVMPNHSPNHTLVTPDGTMYDEDRAGPPAEDSSVVR
jgi:mannose-6-phosphate isomerase-like protein (cupin superfamily)